MCDCGIDTVEYVESYEHDSLKKHNFFKGMTFATWSIDIVIVFHYIFLTAIYLVVNSVFIFYRVCCR